LVMRAREAARTRISGQIRRFRNLCELIRSMLVVLKERFADCESRWGTDVMRDTIVRWPEHKARAEGSHLHDLAAVAYS
jgi:hypothetical protein